MLGVDLTPAPVGAYPHVVIVGAGFGGLACAQALGGTNIRVTVVDRNNYTLFVPLLYQVATAALSPADVAEPIRKTLSRFPNIDVVMGTVTGVDPERRAVVLEGGNYIGYDRLVLAPGSTYSYFGHEEWARFAPPVKCIDDARAIRTRLLSAFEQAETTHAPDQRKALLTTVIVGGGPTGVEMAGAIAELARFALARDFRRIDPRSAEILLVEAGPRLLTAFPEKLAAYAERALERRGVRVLLQTTVERVEAEGVVVNGRLLRAGTIIWGAGIKAASIGDWLGVPTDRGGRVSVAADLSVPGFAGVYAVGDTTALRGEDGQLLPALAQVAKQQGHHLGRSLAANILREEPMRPFRFHNRGNTAVIGRHAAVFDFGSWRLTGWFAWLLWAVVHVVLLVGFENRVLVTTQWLWRYITFQRGARLITPPRAAAASDRE